MHTKQEGSVVPVERPVMIKILSHEGTTYSQGIGTTLEKNADDCTVTKRVKV